MFSYKIEIYENATWTPLKSWARPFTDGTRLDDTLDAGCINLKSTKRSKAIKPFTKLRIIIFEDGQEVDRIYRLVASTKRTRRSWYQCSLPCNDNPCDAFNTNEKEPRVRPRFRLVGKR